MYLPNLGLNKIFGDYICDFQIKSIHKRNLVIFGYISPICSEASSGLICTKFSAELGVADVTDVT